MSTVSVNAACAAANDIARGREPGEQDRDRAAASHSSTRFVPISHTRLPPTAKPDRRAQRAPAATVCPVLSALERSTDSAPSTTQKECWTLLRSADQDRQPEPDGAAQAVLEPHRMALEVRPRALLGGRQRAREPRRGPPEQPLEPRSGAPPPPRHRRCAAIWSTTKLSSWARKLGSSADTASSAVPRRPPGSPVVVAPLELRDRGAQLVQPRRAAGPARGRGRRAGRRLRSSARAAAALTPHTASLAGAPVPPGRRLHDDRVHPAQLVDEPDDRPRRVLSPVGRNGVAKNVACSAATAPSDAATASSCSARPRRRRPAPRRTSARIRRASARQAAIASMRTGSRAGAGHSSAIASSDTPEARPHPASRSGIADAGRGSETRQDEREQQGLRGAGERPSSRPPRTARRSRRAPSRPRPATWCGTRASPAR